MQMEQVNTVKNDGKSDENMTKFLLTFVQAWLSNIYKFFKVIYLGPYTSNWQKGVNLWS
jgi:hypothetical protein